MISMNITEYRMNRITFFASFMIMYFVGYGYYGMQVESPYVGWFFYFFMGIGLMLLVRFRANDIGLSNKIFLLCCVGSMIPYVSGAILLYLTFHKGQGK